MNWNELNGLTSIWIAYQYVDSSPEKLAVVEVEYFKLETKFVRFRRSTDSFIKIVSVDSCRVFSPLSGLLYPLKAIVGW